VSPEGRYSMPKSRLEFGSGRRSHRSALSQRYGLLIVGWIVLLSPAATSQRTRIAGVKPLTPHPELLTLILTVLASTPLVNFNLVSGGVAVGSPSISITTSCVLSLGAPTQFTLYGYFASSSAALSGGSPVTNIPTSAVKGLVATGAPTTYMPFTQSGAFGPAGGSLLLWTTTSNLCLLSSRTDTLSLEIDLTAMPQLPAGTYTGTLYLQAQAM
jgi:hypothetical protein